MFNGCQVNEQMMYVRGIVTIKVLGFERNMRPVYIHVNGLMRVYKHLMHACKWNLSCSTEIQQRIIGSVKVTACHQLDVRE